MTLIDFIDEVKAVESLKDRIIHLIKYCQYFL